ncbi:MAG: DUF1116 domain-containing protein, partial [Hyphomicrobiales bacterium]|nr:DUF1116 domain-containing protein [Hyphomicrobiales bacterium]
EGRASSAEAAEAMAQSGDVRLVPASDYGVMATYGGVITRQTRLLVVENKAGGTRAFAALNEGRGKALRYGSHDPETLARYAWLEGTFAHALGDGIRASGGIDLFDILTQALHMGDDGHSRQKAASALFANAIAPFIVESCSDTATAAQVINFLCENEIFHLPLTMAAAKAALLWAEGISGSTVVTCLAANGDEWGIKVSGTGSKWFTAPVPTVQGHYFDGFGIEDASPVIGDSEIAETIGLGAFAMSGAPALARYVGGTAERATAMAEEMYEITLDEHPHFKIPALNYRGTPFGIDVQLVVERNIEPIFNSGIAHRIPGIGQIGAGFGRVPMACFEAALNELGSTVSADRSQG